MFLVLTFFLNAAMNFVVILVIARLLGPQDYGQYAVAFMIVTVLSTILFDWLRLSATRHYNEKVRGDDPSVRASLDLAYLALGLCLAATAFVLGLFPIDSTFSAALIGAIAVATFVNGQYEYWAALSRARFHNRAYGQLTVCKNVFVLILVVAAGLASQSSLWVLLAFTAGTALAIGTVWRPLHDGQAKLALARRDRVFAFARYGLPIVTANVLYQIIVLANRWILSAKLGYAEAGQLSLPTDMVIRLFLSIGAGLDVFLFQHAVRLEATEGLAAARAQIAKNMSFVMALLFPLAGGYAAIMPSFEALIVPASYHGHYGAISFILIPGVLGFCLTQFAFGPVFQITRETMPVIWAPGAALLCDVGLLLCLPAEAGTVAYAAVHSASLLLATLVSGFCAWRVKACRPAMGEIALIMLCTALMMAAIWPLRMIAQPWLALASAVMLGVIVYAGAVLAFNLLGLRPILLGRLMGRAAQ